MIVEDVVTGGCMAHYTLARSRGVIVWRSRKKRSNYPPGTLWYYIIWSDGSRGWRPADMYHRYWRLGENLLNIHRGRLTRIL